MLLRNFFIADGIYIVYMLGADGEIETIILWYRISAWVKINYHLARNERICWVISVKKSETRKDHVRRTVTELIDGKRRPCCWAGCPHR
jgi:hypothetical protein